MHIPFCKQACTYCNFHFTTSLRYKEPLLAALAKEAQMEKDYIEGEKINTVYFGGGTPSLLSSEEIKTLLSTLRKHFDIDETAEVTLETNPDDISETSLQSWKTVSA